MMVSQFSPLLFVIILQMFYQCPIYSMKLQLNILYPKLLCIIKTCTCPSTTIPLLFITKYINHNVHLIYFINYFCALFCICSFVVIKISVTFIKDSINYNIYINYNSYTNLIYSHIIINILVMAACHICKQKLSSQFIQSMKYLIGL